MEYIINNKDIQISQTENSFNLQYRIINNQMYLDKLINFQFLNIIYELNKSLFDDFKIQIISEDKSTIYILFKWLFKDFDITKLEEKGYIGATDQPLRAHNIIIYAVDSIYAVNTIYAVDYDFYFHHVDNMIPPSICICSINSRLTHFSK